MKKTKQIILGLFFFLLLFLPSTKAEAKDTLSQRKTQAATKIYECLSSFQEYADISSYRIPYSEKNATYLLDQALDRDLVLFNTLANVSDFSSEDDFCSCYKKGKYITAFAFHYKGISTDTLNSQYQALAAKVTAIQNQLQLSKLSPEWAVLKVHDYIALHTDYDNAKHPKRKRYTAYGALVEGKAVCSGYATACELLLSKVGVPTKIVTSDAMDHAWNVVKLGGHWYHMDITWDDPYTHKKDYVSYRFFLKSDAEFRSDSLHPHFGWEKTVNCNSTKYQKIPKKDNGSLFYWKGSWYLSSQTKKGIYYYKEYNFSFTRRKRSPLSWYVLRKTLQKNMSAR